MKLYPYRLKLRNPFSLSIALSSQIWYPKYIAFHKEVNIGKGVILKNDDIPSNHALWNIQIGEKSIIRPYSILETNSGFINIGRDVYINYYACIMAEGGVSIGDNVMIGPHCTLVASHHTFSDRAALIKDQKNSVPAKPIKIGTDVWIGANVVILEGVTIGSGSIIGAGSVVTKDIPSNTVAYGSPAIVMRER